MSHDSSIQTTILFHGNCIDGWFSAYFAYSALLSRGDIQMFPISPSQPTTWPSSETMEGTDVWLLDVSVAESYREEWFQGGARSIQCIDHHATAIEHWPTECCPIHTDCCAALQTFRHFFPEREVPEWLHSIDRVDRWVNVTHEDRCLREYLYDIAKKPVQKMLGEAFRLTDAFIESPEKMADFLAQGEKSLAQKDTQLLRLIETKGGFVQISFDHAEKWSLPPSWLGANVFLMDTTSVTLDTTEAAHLVFLKYPGADVFINFRKKTFYANGPHMGKKTMKSMMVYSARRSESCTMSLTEDTLFRGHPSSAGASLVAGECKSFPFV